MSGRSRHDHHRYKEHIGLFAAKLAMITGAHAAARERVWVFAGAPVQDGRVVIDIDATLVTAHSDIGQHHSGSAGPPSISHTRLPSATHQNAASAATGLLLQLVDEFRGLRLSRPVGGVLLGRADRLAIR